MHNARKRLLAGPYLVWIIGFTVLPILMILYYAFTNSDGGFTWANIAAIADPVHIKALLLSLKLGILCTVVCLLLSYPLAMILNSLHIKHQSFVVFIFVLPMWMNFMLRILAWQMLLSNNGIMIYDFLPFMIMPIYNSIVRIRKETIDAARDLGANSFITFFRIILPLTVPGIVSGIIMVFVPALTSFVISDLLGGGKVLLIGNVIEQSFMQGSYWNLGSGLSIVLMLFVLISMAFMNRAGESGGHAVW